MTRAKARPAGGTAVMASRVEAPDALDYFPTPPWATRALLEFLGPIVDEDQIVWEPACGHGHMVDVLREFPWRVMASDVFAYTPGQQVGSFVGQGPDVMPDFDVDWVITNPPFTLAEEFVLRALGIAEMGVAMLVRSVWLEGAGRYLRLFRPHPPVAVLQFCDRVPMVKGRWDPRASSATAYSWVIWRKGYTGHTRLAWVPPGANGRLWRSDDVARFAGRGVAMEGML